jgi:hypothetical protein
VTKRAERLVGAEGDLDDNAKVPALEWGEPSKLSPVLPNPARKAPRRTGSWMARTSINHRLICLNLYNAREPSNPRMDLFQD